MSQIQPADLSLWETRDNGSIFLILAPKGEARREPKRSDQGFSPIRESVGYWLLAIGYSRSATALRVLPAPDIQQARMIPAG
jgi:hypothetical protein